MKVICHGPTCDPWRYREKVYRQESMKTPFDTLTIGLVLKGSIMPSGWKLIVLRDEIVACCEQCQEYIDKNSHRFIFPHPAET